MTRFARWGDDLSKRIIVDAKRYQDKVDIKDVEAFESMMRDCRAVRGIIVCPKGWTDGAKRRAQDAITVMLLSVEDLKNGSWEASFDECIAACTRGRKRVRAGLVLWDAQHLIEIDGTWVIVYTGKCDACHNYHVWCWDCGEKFALDDEDEHRCHCGRRWLSMIEEEIDDPTDSTLNAVHLLLWIGGNIIPLDRRMLR